MAIGLIAFSLNFLFFLAKKKSFWLSGLMLLNIFKPV
jgi:hypothetical protein